MTTFSLILATGARYMLPIMLLFSVFLLLRGHYEPGGGFVGGLAAGAAFVLFAVAFGVQRAREILQIDPRMLIGIGLLVALGSGFIGMLFGYQFMAGIWFMYEIPAIGKVGSPLLFDIGVYLVVVGVVLEIIFVLAEE
jgi:multicomponent Na+:H+ antiporter subunit B